MGAAAGTRDRPTSTNCGATSTRRLAAIFGRRGGGTSGGGGEPPSLRQLGGGFGLLAALVVVVWLASGFYIVDESQRGVVLTFGKYSEATRPGLRWRLPYPIQSVEIVNVSQVRTVEIGYRGTSKSKVAREALMLTDDENIVDIQFAVQYTLKDPEDFLFNIRRPEQVVMQVAETAMREIVGKIQHGLRALRRARADRGLRAEADAGHPGPLQDGRRRSAG